MATRGDDEAPADTARAKEDHKNFSRSLADVKPRHPTDAERQAARKNYAEEEESYGDAAKYSDGEMKSIERDQALKLRRIYSDKGYRFVRGSVAALFGLLGVDLLLKAIFYAVYLAAPEANRPATMFAGITSDIWLPLIGAVTVNILGVFLFVIKNLFPAKSEE